MYSQTCDGMDSANFSEHYWASARAPVSCFGLILRGPWEYLATIGESSFRRFPSKSMKKYLAEFVGTFWLVLGGCGSAVIAAGFPDVGIGLLGVAVACGVTVLTMA